MASKVAMTNTDREAKMVENSSLLHGIGDAIWVSFLDKQVNYYENE